MKILPAKHLIAFVLRRTGFGGVTLPWAIYILPERMDDTELRRHEIVHWEQKRRMGTVKFYFLYLVYWLRYGYKNHPFEIEARERG